MAMTEDGLSPADFAATAARAIAACAGLTARQQAERLGGDGLLGVTAGEEVGGLDLPAAFAVPVAAASAGLLGFPLLETLLLGRLLQAPLPDVSRAIVSGAACATIAWTNAASAKPEGDRVVLSGCAGRAPCAADVDWLLVRVGDDAAALVPVTASGVTLEPTGLDLAMPEHTVRLDHVSIAERNLLPAGTWPLLQSDALVLRAAAIMGSAEACLAMAQEHASTRRQFGHALAYNQAIRHALARHKLGLESIRHAITRSLFGEASALERNAAFLAAASYGVAISQGALQIHGGMGFTWDVPIHRHLRRILALQAQGDASGLLRALGHRYVAEIEPASEAAA
ncbi:acyl-CoA dehydrogenase [Bradyrhizobium sp. SRL28]|uniref:acyl-CoA dehydrogenase family protein n=1 Tax=Bradyrhizobium sp. SRL28 TaxID=2836178 RepID=UPI001BDE36DB|nr:acyl-CoA dehydrogenase family protein [Bradyrhizobium sp. SRL28]MBT1509277.1 acyl-CoA dehydrogenase [Bradyrhizobium sp. SRL28]